MKPQQKFERTLSKKSLLSHNLFLHIIIKNSVSKNKIIDSAYFEECDFFQDEKMN